MKLKLGIVFTNNQIPKFGYLVYADDQLYKITDVSEESVNLISVFDGSAYACTKSELCDKYIKFIAIHEKCMYSIIHGDYSDIIRYIESLYPTSESRDKVIGSLINSEIEFLINGFLKKIYCRINEKDIVEIVNLDIIDSHKLLDKRDRLFTVETKIDSGTNTRYILKSNGIIINTNRESFKIVGHPNYKSLFSIKANKNEIKY